MSPVGGLCSASISFSETERYLAWVAMLALIGAAVIAYLVIHKLHVILPVWGDCSLERRFCGRSLCDVRR